MKRSLKLFVILIMSVMITGCVKVEFSMGINKDKSMNLEIIQAFDKSLGSNGNGSFDKEGIEDAENQGFFVTDYSDESMEGYKMTKNFSNIDNLSTEDLDHVSDLDLLFEEYNPYLFSIKKGFFKNTYIAKLKFSSTDDFTGGFDNTESNSDDSTIDISGDSSFDMTEDFDYSQMMSGMDMKFIVNLPYKAINSNATSVSNSEKTLTWDLITLQNQNIEFEFELYNMTNVYITIGGIILAIVLVVVFIIKSVNKGNTLSYRNISSGFNNQNYYTNDHMNTDYNNLDNFNSFDNSNDISNFNYAKDSNNYDNSVSNTNNSNYFEQTSSLNNLNDINFINTNNDLNNGIVNNDNSELRPLDNNNQNSNN